MLLQWGLMVGLLLLAGFAFDAQGEFKHSVILTWFIVTPLALTGTHALRHRVRWLRPWHRRTALHHHRRQRGRRGAGAPPAAHGIPRLLRLPQRRPHREGPRSDKLVGHCKDVANYVRKHNVNVVYIALPLANVPRMSELVNALRDTTASVYFVPDAFAFDLIQGRLVEINGMPALSVCETPLHGMPAVCKRAMDVGIAGFGLLVLSPLLLLIAAAVRLTSGGPALFRQRAIRPRRRGDPGL